MGANNSNTRTENLIDQYIKNLPNHEGNPLSGQQAFDFYTQKNQFTNISLFNDPQFARKINSMAMTENDANRLWLLANRVNLKAQKEFNAKN